MALRDKKTRGYELPRELGFEDWEKPLSDEELADFAYEYKPTVPDVAQQYASSILSGVADVPASLLEAGGLATSAVGLGGKEGAHKIANKVRDIAKAVIPEVKELRDNLITPLGSAVGSGFGFVGLGALGKAAKIPQYLTSAGLGAAINGAAGYYDTLYSYDDPESDKAQREAWKSFLLNGLVGTSEAAGLGRVLHKVDKRSGGALKKLLLDQAVDGVEEAAQEAFQTAMGNVIRDYTTEEEVDYMEGVLEGAGAGFFSSFVLGGVLEARRRPQGEDGPGVTDEADRAVYDATAAQKAQEEQEAVVQKREEAEREVLPDVPDRDTVATTLREWGPQAEKTFDEVKAAEARVEESGTPREELKKIAQEWGILEAPQEAAPAKEEKAPEPEAKPAPAKEPEVTAPEVPRGTQEAAPEPEEVGKVHHGTAAEFEEFSGEFVGSGEGAQAHGHGIYFAKKKDVAEFYRKSVSKLKAAEMLSKGETNIPEGQVKTVFLKPTEGELLDLDKPLSEQPEVLGKIEKLKEGLSKFGELVYAESDTGRDLLQDLNRLVEEKFIQDSGGKGQALTEALKDSPRIVSAELLRAGIKGNVYLDAVSREEGKGSQNYVIFDPRDIAYAPKGWRTVETEAKGPPRITEKNATSKEARQANLSNVEIDQEVLRKAAEQKNEPPEKTYLGAGIIPFFKTPSRSQVWNFLKENFLSRGHLPKSADRENILRGGLIDAETEQLKIHLRAFEADAAKSWGRDWRLNPQVAEQINKALANPVGAVTELEGDKEGKVLRVLNRMRLQVDALTQKLVREELVEGDLALRLAQNEGFYVHRSYRAWDDPKWAEKAPVEVRNRFKSFLRKTFISNDRVEKIEARYARGIERRIKNMLRLSKVRKQKEVARGKAQLAGLDEASRKAVSAITKLQDLALSSTKKIRELQEASLDRLQKFADRVKKARGKEHDAALAEWRKNRKETEAKLREAKKKMQDALAKSGDQTAVRRASREFRRETRRIEAVEKKIDEVVGRIEGRIAAGNKPLTVALANQIKSLKGRFVSVAARQEQRIINRGAKIRNQFIERIGKVKTRVEERTERRIENEFYSIEARIEEEVARIEKRAQERIEKEARPFVEREKTRRDIQAVRDRYAELVRNIVSSVNIEGLSDVEAVQEREKARKAAREQLRPIMEKVIDAREKAFDEGLGGELTEEELDAFIQNFLNRRSPTDNPIAHQAGVPLGRKDLSVTKRRQDIHEIVRDVLGENKDPAVIFINTVQNLSQLLANGRFLRNVRASGLNEGFFSKEPKGDKTYNIGESDNPALAPMGGVYTTKEIYEAFTEVLAPPKDRVWYARAYLTLNAIVKIGKTAGYPLSLARNYLYNVLVALNAGHLSPILLPGRGTLSSLRRTFKTFSDSEAWQKRWKRWTELRIVNDSYHSGEVRQYVEDFWESAEFVPEVGYLKAAKKFLRKGIETITHFYSVGDVSWKINGFEADLAAYREAYPDMPIDKLEEMVAEIINDQYPTASKLPAAARALQRVWIVGPFVTFSAEILRTQVAGKIQMAKELKSKNPKVRKIGAKRLAGSIAAYSIANYGLEQFFKWRSGIDDEDDENLRVFIAEYSQNHQILHGGLEDDGETYSYTDWSFSNPYAINETPFIAWMRGEDMGESATNLLMEFLDPFLGEEIIAGAVFDIVRNKKRSGGKVVSESAPEAEQFLGKVGHLLNTGLPGIKTTLVEAYKGHYGYTAKYGRQYDLKETIIANLTGQRRVRVNIPQALSFLAGDFQKAMRDSSSSLSTYLSSGKPVMSDEDLTEAYDKIEQERKHAFKDIRRAAKAAIGLGIPEKRVVQMLRVKMSRRNARDIMDGRYRPWSPSRNFMGDVIELNRATKPERAEEIKRRVNFIDDLSNQRKEQIFP